MKSFMSHIVHDHTSKENRLVSVFLCLVLMIFMMQGSSVTVQAAKPNLSLTVKIVKASKEKMNVKENEICYMHTGETLTFTAGSTAKWSSTNTKIATVTKNGVVSIPKSCMKGTCYIKAKVGSKTYSRRIVVSSLKMDNSLPFHISDYEQVVTIMTGEYGSGENEDLEPSISISKCSSSNPSVATTEIRDWGANLYLLMNKPGKTTVSATFVTDAGTTFLSKAEVVIVDVEKEEKKAREKWIKENPLNLSEEEIIKKINEFRENLPKDAHWAGEESYGGVYGCGGFAMKLSDYIYGNAVYAEWEDENWSASVHRTDGEIAFFQTFSDFSLEKYNANYSWPNGITWFSNDYDRIRVGDVLFLNCAGVGATVTHVCLVMGKGNDHGRECIYTADGNSGSKSGISFDNILLREWMEDIKFTIASRNLPE